MSETGSEASGNTEKSSFLQNLINTPNLKLYIVGGIVAIFVGLVVYKIVHVLLNNPVTSAVSNVLGVAALGLTDFLGGCCSQSACDAGTEDACGSQCGCAWDDKRGCINMSGNNVGDGGMFSPKCGFFAFEIAGIIAAGLVGIAGLYKAMSNSKTETQKALEDSARTSGNSVSDVVKKARSQAEEAVRDAEAKRGEKYSSKADIKYANETALTEVSKKIVESTAPDAATADKIKSRIDADFQARCTETAKDQGVNTDDIKEEVKEQVEE